MNCSQVKREIALWVGQDLDDPARRTEVKRHVSSCPECRDHYRHMKQTLQVLERADREPTYQAGDSLWPAVAEQISHGSEPESPGRFNGWMPFIAMTAACLTLMVVINEQPQQPVGAPTTRGPALPLPIAERPVHHEAFQNWDRPPVADHLDAEPQHPQERVPVLRPGARFE